MTTGESIDNVNMDNVTVTSDEAYERVTSDEHFTDESGEGYLKQNTAGLVQEIPNISFLDIADTMLENKKTLYDRKNWVLRVGKAGKSIEAQPQDTARMYLTSDKALGFEGDVIRFDGDISSLNNTVCEIEDNKYMIKILETGYYRISYGWTINPGACTAIYALIRNSTSTDPIVGEDFVGGTYGSKMSGGRTIGNVYLEKGDEITLVILGTGDDITVCKDFTYLEIQFQQYTI